MTTRAGTGSAMRLSQAPFHAFSMNNFLRSFVFMNIAGCTFIFENRRQDSGVGSQNSGPLPRDLPSTTCHLPSTPEIRPQFECAFFTFPLFSYISPDAPSFFATLCHPVPASQVERRGISIAVVFLAPLVSRGPSPLLDPRDQFLTILCFHTYRRMHLHFSFLC